MSTEWLNLGHQGGDYGPLLAWLTPPPFDELVEIDLYNDRCRNIYHVEGKYFVPFMEGAWTKLYRYASEHMVHPSDRGAYSALMDPDKLQSRLDSAPIPGVRSAEFRFRSMDSSWIWTRQVMISGTKNGLDEGIVRCYIYDISCRSRESRAHRPEFHAARWCAATI